MSPPFFRAAQQALAPLSGFQSLLRQCSSAADRKRLVLTAWECGALSRDEAGLLVTAHQLETA